MMGTVRRSCTRMDGVEPSVYPRDMDAVQTKVFLDSQGQLQFDGIEIFHLTYFKFSAVLHETGYRKRHTIVVL